MRIQHNIPAMNAYRNYNSNVKSLQANLQKLSSGYRINKAGDDAAGLAISEKMRAQITGLETAQKNAKDGISLVQTAEGAMTEVHDMLNRMYELAEQSANGTYQDDVDREQMQKEIESLRTEINRIADSTNFNGIKLLDGSMSSEGTKAQMNSSEFKVVAAGATAASGELPPVGTTVNDNGTTVLHAAGTPAVSDTTFGINFHNSTITGDKDDTFTLSIGTTTLTGTLAANAGAGAELSAADIVDALTGDTSKITFAAYDKDAVTIDGATFKVEKDGTEGVKFTMTGGTAPTKVDYDVALAKGTDTTTPAGQAPTVTSTAGYAGNAVPTVGGGTPALTASAGQVEVDLSSITLTGGTDKLTLQIAAGLTVDSDVITPDDAKDAAKIAQAFVGKQFSYGGGENFVAELDPTNDKKLLFKSTTAGSTTNVTTTGATPTATALTASDGKVTVDFGTKTGAEVIGSSITVDGVTYEFVKAAGDATTGNTAVVVGEGDAAADLATKLVTAAATKGANVGTVAAGTAANGDDMKVTFTGTTGTATLASDSSSTTPVNVAVGGQLSWKATNQSIQADAGAATLAQTSFDLDSSLVADGSSIRIGDDTYTFGNGDNNTIKIDDLDLTTTAGLDKAAERLTAAAAKNAIYSVGQKGHKITLTEQVSYNNNGKYDLSTKEGIEESLGFSSVKSAAKAGKPLTLQIGDTSDEYNKMKVDINDMHANAMGIGDIDISHQEGASTAMDAIKNAINYVSDTRGDLGAIQNRLDHTINNLSVAQENIQDAESTIRDVDVAEEMMAYTKNNILVQAAQAMLAQANQLPQGVLQLLG